MAMERQAKDGTFYKQVGADDWEPVTRQAKDGTVYKKVGADDWEPLTSPQQEAPEDSGSMNDYKVAAERGVLQGARPFVAGLGGAIGGAISSLESGDGLLEKLQGVPSAMGKGFSTERTAAQEEEAELQARRPGLVMTADVGGALLTAPLLAAKGAQSVGQAAKLGANATRLEKAAHLASGLAQGSGHAAKVGAGLSTAQALGHANSAGEAIEMIGAGTALGGASQIGLNAVGKAAPVVWNGAKKVAVKGASALTGISEKEILTYATRLGEVTKLIEKSGGNVSDAADQLRERTTQQIQVARQKLGNQIGKALDDPKYWSTTVDANPLLQKLDEAIGQVSETTARFRPDEINELKNLRDLVQKSMGEGGQVALKTLSELKEELQAIATPSYNNGSRIFPKGDLAARASKGAAGEARRLLNAAAPEIKAANDQLRKLHLIEEGLNKNLIRSGRSESALLAAGSGANPRSAKYLSQIDEITGGDSLRQAENLAAGNTFNNAKLLPMDATGKALARMATGGVVGYVTGGEQGAMVGGALTSPFALKTLINGGQMAQAATRAVRGAIPKAAPSAAKAGATSLISKESAAAMKSSQLPRAAESELDTDSSQPANYREYPDGASAKPLKGKDLWMSNGVKKLQAHGAELDFAALMNDPKGKELILRASDLKPGSKMMGEVVSRLRGDRAARNGKV